jgi:hypothetical protein
MKFLGQEIVFVEPDPKRPVPGVYKSWATKFFMVVPNIFSITITIYFNNKSSKICCS